MVVSLLDGKGYWIGLMVMAPMLAIRLSTEYIETLYRIYETVAVAGALLIVYNMFKVAVPASAAEQTMEQDSEKISNEEQGGTEKMKLERCPNGHFYDSAKYGDSCPYCAVTQQTDMTQEPEASAASEAPKEAAPAAVPEAPEQPNTPVKVQKEKLDKKQNHVASEKRATENQIPVPVGSSVQPAVQKKKQPVVGWLVCTRGVYRGESFTLKAGRNFIGRSLDMDVCLQEDDSIAEVKQAAIIYEPRSRQFIFMPGDVHELCYINNKVALSSASIGAYDALEMGNTSLLLIPCCGEKFNWEDGLVK